MTLQISKREPELVDESLGFYSSGCWTVKGAGVCAMFLFNHPSDRSKVYCGEDEAHRQAVIFMVAMTQQGEESPKRVKAISISVDRLEVDE